MNEDTTGVEPKQKNKRRLLILILLLLLLGATLWYGWTRQPRILSLLPGMQAILPVSPPNYLFSIHGVDTPLGVAISPDGNRVYVTETEGERLIKAFDRDGKFLFSFSKPDTTKLGRVPLYVAVDSKGKVYVSDRLLEEVQVYSSDGKYEGTLPTGGAPAAMTFDKLGNFYVTDFTKGKQRVLVYGPDHKFRFEFGTEGDKEVQFSFPNGIAVDNDGRIFVSDSNNSRIQVFNSKGEFQFALGKTKGTGSLSLPRGLALDGQNHLFVADLVNQCFFGYDIGDKGGKGKAKFLFSVGQEGIGDGQFNQPNGLAIDSRGRIYVTDSLSGRVQVWGT